jgi:hypothetical protein
MNDPIGSEAIVAKEVIIEFASWVVNSKHTAISDVVRELEQMLKAAYQRGRDSVRDFPAGQPDEDQVACCGQD